MTQKRNKRLHRPQSEDPVFKWMVRVRTYNGAIDSAVRVRAASMFEATIKARRGASKRHPAYKPDDWYPLYAVLYDVERYEKLFTELRKEGREVPSDRDRR